MRMFILIICLALSGCVTTGHTIDKSKMAEGYYTRGVSYLQEKNYEMASVEFNRSLQNDSSYKQSY
jgi:Tfp pilus assembly protein PilF